MARTRNFAKQIERKLAANPKLRSSVEKELFNAEIASQIYRARMQAGLTQDELAQRTGTRQSVIARLEDAEYGGHSLTMVWRIADALDRRLHLEFRARSRKPSTATRRSEPKAKQ